MPMDRRIVCRWAALCVAAVLASSGCRNLRREVPPERPFNPNAAGDSHVGFSSDPHPAINAGSNLNSVAVPGQAATGPAFSQFAPTTGGLATPPTPSPSAGTTGQPLLADPNDPGGSAGAPR
jgi:hypothetical protein